MFSVLYRDGELKQSVESSQDSGRMTVLRRFLNQVGQFSCARQLTSVRENRCTCAALIDIGVSLKPHAYVISTHK